MKQNHKTTKQYIASKASYRQFAKRSEPYKISSLLYLSHSKIKERKMNIKNFAHNINTTILHKGKDYFNKGAVKSLEEKEDHWLAVVEGREPYDVILHGKDNFEKWDCGCTSRHDPVCKHIVAVFFKLEEQFENPLKTSNKNLVENNKGCQSDYGDLLSLANECIAQSPGFEEYLKDWFADMAAIRNIQNLETLEIEQNLEQLGWILRFQWLRFASQYSHRFLKSPIIGPYAGTVSGAWFRFPYDRWLKPKYLEERCNDFHPTPAGWNGEHLLFASGMAAANAAIQYSRTKLNDLPQLHLYEFGGYFEYERLLRYTSTENFKAEICKDHKSLIEIVRNSKANILMIEPVASCWPIEVFDIQKFKEAWFTAEKIPYSVIIDTSTIGCVFPMKEFLHILSERPTMVMEVSSGLKLDQVGLEFANIGILSMYLPDKVRSKKRHSRLKRLARIRRTFGLSVTFTELSALEFPAFLNRSRQLKHIKSVYANNAFFAKSMDQIGKGIFADIAHPSLFKNASSWAGAPFVLMRLQGEEEEDRTLIKEVLRKEAKERGLCFNKGSSFGFRSHRFEMGIGGTPGSTGIRIAIGSRSGPSLHGVIELFNYLGTYKNFSALRAAYSGKL